jgi:glycosyltransferase involved in cell wall biosynthesis
MRIPGQLSPEIKNFVAIAESDILVLRSFMEGLPVVLREALALGKPVVASRVAGIPELVEHGQSGLLFTPSDLIALELSFAHNLAKRDDWSDMGRSGRLRVKRDFNLLQLVLVCRSCSHLG